MLLAEQSPKEVSILQCAEYAHVPPLSHPFPNVPVAQGEAALEALDPGLLHILLLLEVLKLVEGGNVSAGK